MISLEPHQDGTLLPVKAQAGVRDNKVAGVHDGMLKVRVSAAPEKGKANAAIAALLGKSIGVPKSSIQLIAGATSTQKRFLVRGLQPDELGELLRRIVVEERGGDRGT